MDSPLRRESACWTYFDVIDRAGHLAQCKLCSKTFSYRTTVSNLTKHVKKSHPKAVSDNCYVEEDKYSVEVSTPRRKHGTTWPHFKIINSFKKLARCKHCDAELSYRSVSNLTKHLQRMHEGNMLISSEDEGENSSHIKYEDSTDDDDDHGRADAGSEADNSIQIWQYFNCLDERLQIASCLTCNKRITYSSDDNLKKHLLRRHPDMLTGDDNDEPTILIAQNGEYYEIETNDNESMEEQVGAVEMDHVYLKSPRKSNNIHRKRQKTKHITGPIIQNFTKEDSLDHFGKYLVSLMRKLPQNVSEKLQIDFVKQAMESQSCFNTNCIGVNTCDELEIVGNVHKMEDASRDSRNGAAEIKVDIQKVEDADE